MTLVEVENLRVTFPGPVHAVRGISFTVERGECVAIVGESGSGKSVTARTLVGLAGATAIVEAGTLRLDGRDTIGFGDREWRRLRGRVAGLVLQDALVSLDPLNTVGQEIGEVLRVHAIGTAGERTGRVTALLDAVGVPDPAERAEQYPHQLSGGLRQRALIASAIAADPPLLIADEPTTALDVTVQAQLLRLLAERKAAGSTLLLVSHDLAVVSSIADRVLVMHDGVIVEQGPTAAVLADPQHEYTKLLLAAVPTAASKGLRLSSAERVALPQRAVAADDVVLRAEGLQHHYGARHVVDDVGFTLARGETLGIVGESGSGKTTVARIALGLVEPAAGAVHLGGTRWSGVPERRRRPLRRRIQVIAQDPLSSFDPRYTVEKLVAEPLDLRGAARRDRVVELLERVGLGPAHLRRHPRELSGGQRQRVAIARAVGPRPDVIVCDEPVSALDVSIQAQVLDLLADLQAADGTALLFISHDLGVVHHLADRVLVMHDGRVVEQGPVEEVFTRPTDDYTKALLAAVPRLEAAR
ncbi:ABC transporter ATP-binding protein [Dactylosporangium vinaceum]|uniref:Dipeptide ABC transporter ATP-binding protein n=1 Tax=Dactylosporangium vinaceum TaxID=53362 RepID=A0ABV5M7W1_9ACTN|nr:ABC transporter ATP-binding protein [Dactylosporangium vinaceum]UAB92286.1 ABC transporter ATP-binding protein [Dactylosporangium vinaceum]